MSAVYTSCGECLEVRFSGTMHREDAVVLWRNLESGVRFCIVDLRNVSQCLSKSDIESVAWTVKKIPDFPLAFLCETMVKFGEVRRLAGLTDLDVYQIFDTRQKAVKWLEQEGCNMTANEQTVFPGG